VGSGRYTARVTDFGYSTRFANEDDGFTMPKSWPWNAPEHHHRKFRPAQARKMDLFSLGMVCLWVIFEKYLSGIVPLPQEILWVEPYIQSCGEKHRSKSILQAAKDENKLVQLARQLVMAEGDLEDYQKEQLRRFFDASLVREPNSRDVDLKQTFGSVFEKDEDKIIQLLSEMVTEDEDLDSDPKEALRQSLANDPNFRDAYLKP
jgi:serine/threonine protein kinase